MAPAKRHVALSSAGVKGTPMKIVGGVAQAWVAAALLLVGGAGAQAAAVSGQGTWASTLQARDLDGNFANGAEAYFDTVLHITWLADANYARTSGYDRDRDGRMAWDAAVYWAESLDYFGVTGWRLPKVVDTGAPGCDPSWGGTDCGVNVQTASGGVVYSEMAHLYYVTLGDTSGFNESGQAVGNANYRNTGPFKNLLTSGVGDTYWTGQQDALNTYLVWSFLFIGGDQRPYDRWAGTRNSNGLGLAAWAVHAGDVGANMALAVPEPASAPMAAAALALCGVAARQLMKRSGAAGRRLNRR
jgi:hypothetical protein